MLKLVNYTREWLKIYWKECLAVGAVALTVTSLAVTCCFHHSTTNDIKNLMEYVTSESNDMNNFLLNPDINPYCKYVNNDKDPHKISYTRVGQGTWFVYGMLQYYNVIPTDIMRDLSGAEREHAKGFFQSNGEYWMKDAEKYNIEISNNIDDCSEGDVLLWKIDTKIPNEYYYSYRVAYVIKLDNNIPVIIASNLTRKEKRGDTCVPKLMDYVEHVVVTEDYDNTNNAGYGVFLKSKYCESSKNVLGDPITMGTMLEKINVYQDEHAEYWYKLRKQVIVNGKIDWIEGWAKLEERRALDYPCGFGYEYNFTGIEKHGIRLDKLCPEGYDDIKIIKTSKSDKFQVTD